MSGGPAQARIVQLANFYTPTSGGLRTTVDALGRGYLAAGHQRVLVVPGATDDDRTGPCGRVVTVRSPRLPGLGGYRVVIRLGHLRAVLDELAPDRVEVSDRATLVAAGTWAGRAGVPAVLVAHERLDAILQPRVPPGFPLRALADAANRRAGHHFGVVVGPSRFATAEWARVAHPDVRVVPWGVDLDVFRPSAPMVAPPAADAVRVLVVGRLSAEKRPRRAVEAVAELRRRGVPAHLAVAGTGPAEGALRQVAAGLGVPVRFLGHLADPAELAGAMAAADVVVAPSPAETFCLGALEAMACGTPVVVVAGSGATELLAPGCGTAVGPSADALADGVAAVLGCDECERRQAARCRAETFTWGRAVAAMLAAHGLADGASAREPGGDGAWGRSPREAQ